MEKTDLLVSGCSGRLGSYVVSVAKEDGSFGNIYGVDMVPRDDITCFSSYAEIAGKAAPGVIIDCSNHALSSDVIGYAVSQNIPLVICTTGHTESEMENIMKASEKIPVLKSGNMSLGINVLADLVRKAVASLGEGYDVEIVEAHHNKKLDAPSGTAIMLADAAKDVRPDAYYVYDRHEYRKERDANEIGIHSIRAGNIVGEHSIIISGNDETITLSHSAYSRKVFASGAVNAAKFLAGKPAGFYTMDNVINQ